MEAGSTISGNLVKSLYCEAPFVPISGRQHQRSVDDR